MPELLCYTTKVWLSEPSLEMPFGLSLSGDAMNDTLISIARSWGETSHCRFDTAEILQWVKQRNETVEVDIHKTRLEDCGNWFYDRQEGCIRNENRSFFTITGLQKLQDGTPVLSQPVIMQPEIGYLGIICQEIDGVMHFLMQAKIEPGNVNKIQLSPTIQATKSNFTQKHGGNRPAYLDYFINASQYEIVVDQVQSEQSSRFYKKRNRNILIRVEEEITILDSHRWMTLGQIKQLMREDNLVNMDTRTVLSCIPYSQMDLTEEIRQELSGCFTDRALFRSVFEGVKENLMPPVFQYLNNYKMFNEETLVFPPLHKLEGWTEKDGELVCKTPYPFKLVFCDIAIEGREVRHWTQPLFEATGIATFGLILTEIDGITRFLVHAAPEVGCFDGIELGPTVQREAVTLSQQEDGITRFFLERLENGHGVIFDHLLSEEGGRFYHEQNRNVLMQVDYSELPDLPSDYFLLDYRTLNRLVQVNNTMNIQLRNLLSLLEA